MWDENNNYRWGKLGPNDLIELWGQDNYYMRGRLVITEDRIDFWDDANNHMWGRLSGFNETDI